MIHYLVIGHACDEESEWQFTDSDKELTYDFLEQKFTKESLQEVSNKKIKEVLTGGPEEFVDGPPCLQIICKEIQESGTKLKDERD